MRRPRLQSLRKGPANCIVRGGAALARGKGGPETFLVAVAGHKCRPVEPAAPSYTDSAIGSASFGLIVWACLFSWQLAWQLLRRTVTQRLLVLLFHLLSLRLGQQWLPKCQQPLCVIHKQGLKKQLDRLQHLAKDCCKIRWVCQEGLEGILPRTGPLRAEKWQPTQ